ncbi:Uncharacterised protein [Candidatus Anstonella stagnisolia]|nr:Uncharacterised protein [Candidatus Anstonella stagnisolia]
MKLALPVFVLLVLSVSVLATSYCDALSQYRQKVSYYKEIFDSPQKLAALNMSSGQIERVVSSLSTSLARAEQMCEKEKAAAAAQATNAAEDSGTSATVRETSESSAAGTTARTVTANTENANEAAIEAREKAADVRSETANARLNITSTNTALIREIIAKYNTTDTAAIARIIKAGTIPAGSGANTGSSAVSGSSAIPALPTETTVPSTGALARFAYWWGKVTMVQAASGSWAPASNMRDGANINPLTYCQQLNSRSEGVREVGKTSISGWINRDGKADTEGRASYTESGVVYECLPYRAFDVKTQLDSNVPIFTAPQSEGSAQAATAQIGATSSASATSDEFIAPTGTTAAGDVSDYYTQKMQEILQKNNNIDSQIASLKQLSGEINSLVANLLEQKSRIALNEEGMKEIVKSVRITPTTVSTGDVAVEAKGKIIEARTSAKKPIEVEAKGGSVVIRDNGVEAKASEIDVTSDTVSVGGADVKVTPSEAAKKVNAVSKKISISADKDNKAIYNVQAQTKARIMGVLPVTLNRTVEIDSQTGNIVSDQKPWWSVVAVEDAAQNASAQ